MTKVITNGKIQLYNIFKNLLLKFFRDFPRGQEVETSPSDAGGVVRFLVGELRSHMPCGQKAKIKQKQHCNKFNTLHK